MEKNIIALLNKNLRVIIPDFGAFIIRQKQPRIVVFNEFLRYNDGLLTDFIIRTEGIDREIAEQRVSDFAEESTKALASGKELIIDGLGKLHKDASGRIEFEETGSVGEIQEIMDETEVTNAPVADRREEVQAEPVKPAVRKRTGSTSKVKAKTVRKPAAAKNKTKPASKSTVPKKPAVPSVPVEYRQKPEPPAPVPDEPIQIEEPQVASVTDESSLSGESAASPVSMEYSQPKGPGPSPGPVQPDKAEISKKSHTSFIYRHFANNLTNQILGWVLVFLFVNAAILTWFVFNDAIRGIFKKKAQPVEMISDSLFQQLADSVKAAAMDNSLVYSEKTTDTELNASEDLPSNLRYYIVAGCFRDEANAETLVSSLKGIGFNAEKFGKIGNLYAVCFASFEDKDQAVRELKRIREKIPDAWMTRF